jgi:hypothetical protein
LSRKDCPKKKSASSRATRPERQSYEATVKLRQRYIRNSFEQVSRPEAERSRAVTPHEIALVIAVAELHKLIFGTVGLDLMRARRAFTVAHKSAGAPKGGKQ